MREYCREEAKQVRTYGVADHEGLASHPLVVVDERVPPVGAPNHVVLRQHRRGQSRQRHGGEQCSGPSSLHGFLARTENWFLRRRGP
jgi:hypothetical protein